MDWPSVPSCSLFGYPDTSASVLTVLASLPPVCWLLHVYEKLWSPNFEYFTEKCSLSFFEKQKTHQHWNSLFIDLNSKSVIATVVGVMSWLMIYIGGIYIHAFGTQIGSTGMPTQHQCVTATNWHANFVRLTRGPACCTVQFLTSLTDATRRYDTLAYRLVAWCYWSQLSTLA